MNLAKTLEFDHDGQKRRHVTISVGAAVIPQHAAKHCVPMDVGVDQGRVVGPLQRLVHYACQPEARVDIVRSGLEDTPYHFNEKSGLTLAGNTQLLADTLMEMRKYGYESLTERDDVNRRLHFDVLKDKYTVNMTDLSMDIERNSQPCYR